MLRNSNNPTKLANLRKEYLTRGCLKLKKKERKRKIRKEEKKEERKKRVRGSHSFLCKLVQIGGFTKRRWPHGGV